VVGLDHEAAIKRNLSIVSAITALDLSMDHQRIYNETLNHALLSEFQVREFGIIID
jgi:hypothetical protein